MDADTYALALCDVLERTAADPRAREQALARLGAELGRAPRAPAAAPAVAPVAPESASDRLARYARGWDEGEHPRGEAGKFAEKDGFAARPSGRIIPSEQGGGGRPMTAEQIDALVEKHGFEDAAHARAFLRAAEAHAASKGHYFRLQPKGLGLAGHRSANSMDEESDGLHVFDNPAAVFHLDIGAQGFGAGPMAYGDEVVEIRAPDGHWDNEDVEGVAIDSDGAEVVARYSLRDLAARFFPPEVFGWDAAALEGTDRELYREVGDAREVNAFAGKWLGEEAATVPDEDRRAFLGHAEEE